MRKSTFGRDGAFDNAGDSSGWSSMNPRKYNVS